MDDISKELGSDLSDLVFQVSLDPILLATLAECRIINVNAAFCGASEYQRLEVIGFTGCELKLWQIPEDHDKLIKRLQEQKTVRDFETDLQTKSGQRRQVLISAQIFDHNHEALI
jgi:PAS domain S-box-containing protein